MDVVVFLRVHKRYATGSAVGQLSVVVQQFFDNEVEKQGKDITKAIHLLVDTSLKGGKLDIKAFAGYFFFFIFLFPFPCSPSHCKNSSNVGVKAENQSLIFLELPCEVQMSTAEKIGSNF